MLSSKFVRIPQLFLTGISKSKMSYRENSSRLNGKVAIVTASTQGIGFSIAQRLGEEGAKVVICSRKADNVEKAVHNLKAKSIQVTGIPCNVTKEKERSTLIQTALSTYGKVDILVSNAGTNLAFGSLFDCEESVWDKIFDVNIKSAFYLCKEMAPHLAKSGNGRIVFISSIAGLDPLPALGVYSITKTALLGLTKAAATELAPNNITVNAIAPGIIKTKFSSALTDNPSIADELLKSTRLKRFGKSEEIAGAVAFLVSDDASYITGETIAVSGGMPSRL